MCNRNNLTVAVQKTCTTSLPLVGSRLLHAVTGFVSMAMIAMLGKSAVAAGALMASTASTLLLAVWALLFSVGVVVARNFGKKDMLAVGRVFRAGFVLGLILGVPFSFVMWHADLLLQILGQSSALIDIAKPYFHGIAWGVIPSIWYVVCCEFVMGIAKARLVIVWTACAVPFTLLLSYAFLFGKFGLPAFGVIGIAYALVVTYWLSVVTFLLYFYWSHKFTQFALFNFWGQRFCGVLRLLQIGWPISVQLGTLMASFSMITYMMGWLGESTLAAQQVLEQCLTVSSMIPYGIAQASGVLIGQAIGADCHDYVKKLGLATILVTGGSMLLVSLVFWFGPRTLIACFLNLQSAANSSVINIAILLFAIAGFNQIFDSVRVAMTGALRGFQDTRVPMLIGVATNWILVVPVGYLLSFIFAWHEIGLYLAMAVGAVLSTLILCQRFWLLCDHGLNSTA